MIDHWMFRCKDISELISRSYDEKLPLQIRLGIKIHLMMCHLCARNKAQLDLIQGALESLSSTEQFLPPKKLPDEFRDRLTSLMK